VSRRAALGLALSALIAAPAAAREHELDLSRLSRGDCASTLGSGPLVLQRDGVPVLAPDNLAFRQLVSQIAETAAPTQISPVTTSGPAGFDVSLETTLSSLHDGDALQRGLRGHAAATCDGRASVPAQLYGNRLRFEKGLPLGVSLGANAGIVHGTGLYLVGVDIQVALLEEVWKLPDLALRAAINRVVGAPALSMFVASFDLVLSRRWVLFERLELSPFVGAGARWTHASARADLTPNIDSLNCAAGSDAVCSAGGLGASRDDFAHDVRFDRVSQLRYRAFAGLRLRVSSFALAGAFAFDPVQPQSALGRGAALPRQWTVSVAPSLTF
jgi:hypothetical protein